MTLVLDNTETDTQMRIIVTAERLFREIGYQKTTVADIARVLKMSPANVYRFFDSKKAIHEGVANRLMGEVEAAVAKIASEPLSPTDRLREILATIHHMNAERYIEDNKMHEMVAIAMEESWNVCDAHIERIGKQIGVVVAEGMQTGEFKPGDPELVSRCICTAMSRFFHPQLIAECSGDPEPTLERMIDFVLASVCQPTFAR